jgi:TP53 regulating kinase-like protein
MPGKLIAQGAEAVLSLQRHGGREALVKDRIRKGYRIPQLDERIRRQRTRREADFIHKAQRAGVSTPQILSVGRDKITMEYLDGERIKDTLNTSPKARRGLIYRLIGRAAAGLHSSGIMHGDLTTSNLILRKGRLYVIDFGLGKSTQRPEDFATDLFLLYEALKSTHFKYLNEAWQKILKAYCDNYSNSAEVLNRFRKIENRRRYKG